MFFIPNIRWSSGGTIMFRIKVSCSPARRGVLMTFWKSFAVAGFDPALTHFLKEENMKYEAMYVETKTYLMPLSKGP